MSSVKLKLKSNNVFERAEKKFIIPPDKYERLIKALDPYMQVDQYGLHTIQTIYYDTDDYAIIQHSLDKPAYKEKLRLRSYGIPQEDSPVYLELKKKLDGITYKRRMTMSLHNANAYLEQGITPPESNDAKQTFGEIDCFVRQHQLTGKVLLSYDRIALFGKEDEDFRMTFDGGVRWRNSQVDLSQGDYGTLLLEPGIRLLEVKILGSFPLWLCDILSELGLYSQSFSKYGTVYTQHLSDIRKEVIRIAV